jgi:hypothetical protein
MSDHTVSSQVNYGLAQPADKPLWKTQISGKRKIPFTDLAVVDIQLNNGYLS